MPSIERNNQKANIILQAVSLEKLIQSQIDGNSYLDIHGDKVRIDDIVPDLLGCLLRAETLNIKNQLGQVSSHCSDLFIVTYHDAG